MADNLTVETVKMNAGETKQVAFVLNNPTHKYAAFQFDLVLPEGISVAKNDKGKLIASLNEGRIDDHTLNVSQMGANTYRFLSFSMTNTEFSGNDGALVYVTLQASEGISGGNKTVTIQSQVFTEVSGNQNKWDDTTFTIEINGGGGPDNPDPPVVGDDMLSVEAVSMSAGETKQVAVVLNNPTHKYAGFQFDLVLPEGISIAKNDKGKFIASLNEDRIDDHTLNVSEMGTNTYRFLSFSMTNTEFSGNEGALIYVTLQATESISEGNKTATIQSQVFTEVSGEQHKWSDKTFQITIEAVVPTITITAKNYTREYGEDNPTFEYTVTGGSITSGTPTITCSATKTSSVGIYDIIIEKGTVSNKSVELVKGTLTITKAPLKITANDYTIKQGETLPTFEATYEGFKNSETQDVLTKQPTITTTATSASEPNTYDIVVSGAEAPNYDISYEKGTLTITEADPVTITAKSYSREYGEANPTFEYTSEGATLVGVPEITCEATATSPVGTYPIVIKKGSVTNYNDTYVNGTLTITKAPLNVKAGTYTKKQGEDNPEFTLTYEGFKNDETEDVLITKPTATTTATKESEPGEYVVTVSGGDAKNYELSYTNGKLIVMDADAVVVTAKSYSREYGEDNPTFEFTSEGATLTGTPEITCKATASSPVGTYDIMISQGTVTNYNVTYVAGTLTITKAPLKITANDYTIKQGETLPTFEATYEGFKNNETKDVLTKQPTITTTATSASEPNTYDIVVSDAEAKNYDISYVNGTLTITEAAPVTITAKNYSREYGEANPTFEFTSEGAALNGTPEITCEATAASPVGTYPIVIKKGTVTNYNDTYINGTLTITKAPLTVKVEDATREQYLENPEFVITYSGWKLNDDESVLTKKPTATTEATKDSPVGTYAIVVSGGEAKNYELNYQNGVLTIIESTGIGEISVTSPADVYTLQGHKVRTKATMLDGLPKGVYVVNGKKVVVK